MALPRCPIWRAPGTLPLVRPSRRVTQLESKAFERARQWLDAPSDDDEENDRRRTAFFKAMSAYFKAMGWKRSRRKALKD